MGEESKCTKKLMQIFSSVRDYRCKTWILFIALIYPTTRTGATTCSLSCSHKCYSLEDLLHVIGRRSLPDPCPNTSKLRACEGAPVCRRPALVLTHRSTLPSAGETPEIPLALLPQKRHLFQLYTSKL